MRLGKKTTSITEARRVRRGFTLVELIVVLTILAILAAIGVGSAVGYIKRSRFNQNEQSAITVYQTAQTAMSQMTSNGTIHAWVQGLINNAELPNITDFDSDDINELNSTNESISKRAHLTYNPGDGSSSAESVALRNLLSSYFYDQTVFEGTIAVEFDISLTCDSNGNRFYSARVVSAYYSKQNTAQIGWDKTCKHSSSDSEAGPNGQLPDTAPEYRYLTSYVGYFDGTEDSAKPQVTSVFLPQSQRYSYDGHVVGPTVDPDASASGYLFNLRNGETLDVSWAIFDEDGTVRGDHDESLTITLVTDTDYPERFRTNGSSLNNAEDYGDVVLTISDEDLEDVRYNVLENSGRTPEYVYENVNGMYTITRKSYDSLINLHVTGPGIDDIYTFPITISWVTGDGRHECPDKDQGYIEYSLSLDCMMTRTDEGLESSKRYNSERLFGVTPRNIYAILAGSYVANPDAANNSESGSDASDDSGNSTAGTVIPATYAARANNDPAFFEGLTTINNNPTYNYEINSRMTAYDITDTTEYNADEDTDSTVTGMCIVNTLFGDCYYSKNNLTSDATEDIYGTHWVGDDHNAVITSFRHLYNVRFIEEGNSANYRIIRDLNWYVNNQGSRPASDVRVYMSNSILADTRASAGYEGVRYHSPVENGNIRIVSFPAISRLYDGQVLTSVAKYSGKIVSVNNIQMRSASFVNTEDEGYGLVCANYGQIYNIYTNNLNLILADVNDGSSSDFFNGTVEIDSDGAMTLSSTDYNRVGGLVGYNHGLIGKKNAAENVIRMNNCVVMGGEYWNLANYTTGGVIGMNVGNNGEESTYGLIELRGSFVVVGGGNSVGGIIGDNESVTEARLIVNGNPVANTTREYTLPVENHSGTTMSCVVAGPNQVGGAIGLQNSRSLDCPVGSQSSTNLNYDTVTGKPLFPTRNSSNDYKIYVELPANALVLKVSSNDGTNAGKIGGAIGSWNSCAGTYASVYVNNGGYIIASDASGNISCGGAIGEDANCTIATVYLDVVNGAGSRIGSMTNSTYGPTYVGGAYGHILGASSQRTIEVNIDNDGTIESRGSDNGQGIGGAIGGTTNAQARFIVDANNQTGSKIIGRRASQDSNIGTGGAIGEMSGTTKLPTGSVVFAENHGSISGVYNVGGSIGNAPENDGKILADNHGAIEGIAVTVNGTSLGGDFVGGAIGRDINLQNNLVQSVLNQGASISGNSFVGGAAGRIQSLKDDENAKVRTLVKGSATIDGAGSLIGGVCGDIEVLGNGLIELAGDAATPTLVVRGGSSSDGVGGVAGIIRSSSDVKVEVKAPDQGTVNAANKLIVRVDGHSYVGGVIGSLRTVSASDDPATLLTGTVSTNNIAVNVSVVLHPESYVKGTGDCVGGAVGIIDTADGNLNCLINVSSAAGSSIEGTTSIVSGGGNVGGAIGKVHRTKPSTADNTGIIVDFNLAGWTISGTNSNVGGAVGFFDSDTAIDKFTLYGNSGNTFPITVSLGQSTVKSASQYVGGAIGRNQITNGNINVTLGGLVEGSTYVGGAIGYNLSNVYMVRSTVTNNGIVRGTGTVSIRSIIGDDQTVKNSNNDWNSYNKELDGGCVNWLDYAANVGGAIGGNLASITSTDGVVVTVSGRVEATTGNNVGGAIGFCNGGFYYNSDDDYNRNRNAKVHKVSRVSSTIQGTGVVQGADNVGGALGLTICNIGTVEANITGQSHIIGHNRIGGAIGFAAAKPGEPGTTVKGGSKWGKIDLVSATISADYALQGDSRIGGAIGQSGAKWAQSGNFYCSADLENVSVTLNSAYLFSSETGPVNNSETAYVGGAIGVFVDGLIGNVVLGGTGGTCNPGYPNITYTNTVLIAARGRSVGGIVGQIGMPNMQQNVCLSNISVNTTGFPYLCVRSTNGADNIGGWIGSGYAGHGGIGNDKKGDYDNLRTRVTYEVRNVRSVYSEGNNVGGFCGLSDAYNNNSTIADRSYTYANINVYLDGANICGGTGVGGVFGRVDNSRYSLGYINVTLSNHTNIGDIVGNTVPGDNTEYTSICYGAGGAIGNVSRVNSYNAKTRDPVFDVPVIVTVDSTSRICGLWNNPNGSAISSDIGVGGAFGTFYGTFNNTAYIQVRSSGSSPVLVQSEQTNVGGAIGVMLGGNLNYDSSNNNDSYDSSKFNNNDCRVYANANVISNGNSVYVGGFVGRMNAGTIKYSSFTGTVTSTGSSTCVGGFVGGMLKVGNSSITNCYAVPLVTGTYVTGGFAGEMDAGGSYSATIENCYVGGHTYQGQYVSGEGNISGGDCVGGFVAYMHSSKSSVSNCYTTASVRGSGNSGTIAGVGGFVGYIKFGKINASYCSGLVSVTSANPSRPQGAFVGFYSTNTTPVTLTDNQALENVNGGVLRLVGNKSDSDVSSQVVFASAGVIRGDTSATAVPIDGSLPTTFDLRAVTGGCHYGDWSLGPQGGTSIENATVTFSDCSDPNNPAYPYSRAAAGVTLDGRISVVVEGHDLVAENKVALEYRDNKAVGTATVVIAAIPGSGYSGIITRSFEITPVDITLASVSISAEQSQRQYTGAPIDPTVTVTINGDTLVQNEDFYLTYERSDLGEAGKYDHTNIGGPITITVHGIREYDANRGNYYGTAEMQVMFTIIGMDISDAIVDMSAAEGLVYNGEEQKPVPYVRLAGEDLVLDTDFYLEYMNNEHAGNNTAYLIIHGMGSYSGQTRRYYFSIAKAPNSWDPEHLPAITGWTYGEESHTPTGQAEFGTELTYVYYNNSACRDQDRVPDISSAGAGDYWVRVTVEGTDDYYATVAKILPFTIAPASITDAVVVTTDHDSVDPVTGIPEYQYDGSVIEPTLSVTISGQSQPLELGTDYQISSYSGDHTDPTSTPITVTITGLGNFTGDNSTCQFTIFREFTVTFSSQGAPIDEYTQTVRAGRTAVNPGDPPEGYEYEGHRFTGWYLNGASEAFDFENNPITGDITLTANWVLTHTITFVTGDPEVVVQPVSVDHDSTAASVRPEDPERDGYVFAGWYLDESYITLYEFNIPVKEDIILYAKWIPKYTVTFDTGEGSPIDSQSIVEGQCASRPETDPEWEGHTFLGWYESEEEGAAEFIFSEHPITGNTIVCAHWELTN